MKYISVEPFLSGLSLYIINYLTKKNKKLQKHEKVLIESFHLRGHNFAGFI